jgi:hypothetical protein
MDIVCIPKILYISFDMISISTPLCSSVVHFFTDKQYMKLLGSICVLL